MEARREATGRPRQQTGALLRESTLHHWADSGRKDVLAKLADALKDVKAGTDAADSVLHRLLYELVWVAAHAKLPRQDVVSVLKDAGLAGKAIATDALIDLLWVIANEVEANERGRERHSSSEWQNLCRLVKTIADEELVPALDLKASLEFDMLHEAGLIESSPAVLARKVVRINTKTLYTQIKYNLLREEPEGFSKVLTLLHAGVSREQLDASKTDLLALIGYFDLDANRVLDLVLDAYEVHPTNDAFVDLLGSFNRESLPHVVGFKFQFYATKMGADAPPEGTQQRPTPRSLYRLAATLLDKKLLTLDALMPHLSPPRRDVVADAKKQTLAIQQAARAFGKVNLAAKKPDEADDEAAAKKKAADGEGGNNQVYGLIIGLLEIGARDMAFDMIDWFQQQGANPFMYKPLALQLCAMLNALVDGVYAPLSLKKLGLTGTGSGTSPSPVVNGTAASGKTPRADTSTNAFIEPAETIDECVAAVFPVVERLGPFLHHDQLLLVKLLRIANHMLTTKKAAWLDQVKSLVVKAFLPALSMQTCNPSISFHVWDLIKVLPFEERYSIYLQWLAAYGEHVELRLVEAQVIQSTRAVMRRLTADRARVSSRHLTHFAHSNPLIAFRTMLRQIQSYDNLIQPVVEAFKFITPLGMDALSFVLVSELAKPQKSMKSDGTHVSLWLQSLANFSGSFYRKYPNVELAGLLQFLMKRLENWESVDLIVLSELLAKMGSCISLEDISLNQLEAQAGGPHLWQELPIDPKLQNRRAIPRLRDALVKRDLVLPLCILICQMRSKIEYQESGPNKMQHLKLLGRVYDTCQLTLSQLLEFMNGVIDPAVYKQMMPSIDALVHEFHVPAELAMTLCRPAIRCDDPVLRRAPRGVNAPSSSASNKDGKDDEAKWFMYNPTLLEDVGRALWGEPKAADSSAERSIGMTRELYVTFWSLTLYDIHIPFSQYESEIQRLRTSLSNQFAPGLTGTERKKLKEKTMQQIDVLTGEQKDQVSHRKRVVEILDQKKGNFFVKEAAGQRDAAVIDLLQRCVLPRALLSPEDALFTAKFIERLHALNTPLFSTVQYLHKVHLNLPSVVLCATEREAGNFGIFLKETLALTYRWYQSGVAFDEEALQGRLGFSLDLANPENPNTTMSHKMFKDGYARWHRHGEKVYASTLASGNYMPIRSTLVVLTKVIDVFPASKGSAEALLEIVQPLTEEDREDIKIMAKRYFALLTKRKNALVVDRMLTLRRVARKPAASGGGSAANATAERAEAGATTRDRESSSNKEREEGENDDEPQSRRQRAADDGDRDDDDRGRRRERDRLSRNDRGDRKRESSPVSGNRELESGEIESAEAAAAPVSSPPARGGSSSRSRRSASNGHTNDADSTRGRHRDADREGEPRRSRERERGDRVGARDGDRGGDRSDDRGGRGDRAGDRGGRGDRNGRGSGRGDRGGRGDRDGSVENRDRREIGRRDHREASPATSRERERVGDGSGSERKTGSDSGRRDRSRPRSDRGGTPDSGARAPRPNEKESSELPPPVPSSTHQRTHGANDTARNREGERGRSRDGARDAGRDTESRPAVRAEEGEPRKRPRLDAAEAVLRRALTEKKAQGERQRQTQEKPAVKATTDATPPPPLQQQQRERPRDKTPIMDRVPATRPAPEASKADKADKPAVSTPTPTGGAGTPTGQRKIVSLVSRKRERDEAASGNPAADAPAGDGKRGRRDDEGGASADVNAGGEGKQRPRDDRRNNGPKRSGGNGQPPQQQQQQHRDEARRQERFNNGRNERQGGGDEPRGGNGNGNNNNNNNRRRDKRNFKGRR